MKLPIFCKIYFQGRDSIIDLIGRQYADVFHVANVLANLFLYRLSNVQKLGKVSSLLSVCENWKWYAVKHNFIT